MRRLVSKAVTDAMRRVANQLEVHPEQHRWVQGLIPGSIQVPGLQRWPTCGCFLALLGEELEMRGTYLDVADKVFGTESYPVYDEVYGSPQDALNDNFPVSTLVANIRAFAARLDAERDGT